MLESRQQLEARLQAASESMSHRLSVMEQEVKLPTATEMVESVPPRMAKKVAIAVAAGLLVGLSLGRKKRSRRRRIEAGWSNELAESVARLLKDGTEPGDAVRKAVRKQHLPADSGGGSGGLMAFLLGYAVKQGANALVREIVNRVTSRNGSDTAS